MPDRFAIIGAGGHAKVVVDALLASGNEVLCFYDDNPALIGAEPITGVKVLGGTKELTMGSKRICMLILAIGENRLRFRLSRRLSVRVLPSRAEPGCYATVRNGCCCA